MKADLFRRGGWFDRTYREGLLKAKRYHTTKAALTLVSQRTECPEIVETGCQHNAEEWGAGCSTTVLADFIAQGFGQLYTVDASADHLARCKAITERFPHIVYICDDSVEWLEDRGTIPVDSIGVPLDPRDDYPDGYRDPIRPRAGSAIDLLYLDSFDYPYGTLLEAYGGKSDIESARKIVEGMSDEAIVDRFGSVIAPCQEHCLAEIQAAAPSLTPGAVVLIDDVLPGGGKPRLAKEWMRAQGWLHVLEDYQTLWVVR